MVAFIINGCFISVFAVIGFFLFKIAREGAIKPAAAKVSDKSMLATAYPWIVLTAPLLFTFGRDGSTGGIGYFIIYYLGLHVPIVFPLAIIATVSKNKKVYITCDILATIGSLPITFLGIIL